MKNYYVYILGSESGTLYIGITSDLKKRVLEHKFKKIDGFTSKYNVNKLLYYENSGRPEIAIAREKQLKGWKRGKKNKLIDDANPAWDDISEEWV